MAIYDNGTASLAANGQVTGIGTQWTMPLTLIRVGATLVFKTEPVQIYTISEITSDTSISVHNPNGETVPAGTGYAILAHDGITVQGLAQDVAETLRFYQSRESEVSQAIDAFKDFDVNEFNNGVSSAENAALSAQTSASESLSSANSAQASAIEAGNYRDSSQQSANQSAASALQSSNSADEAAIYVSALKNNTFNSINDAKSYQPLSVGDFFYINDGVYSNKYVCSSTAVLGNENDDQFTLRAGVYAKLQSRARVTSTTAVRTTSPIGNLRCGDIQYRRTGSSAEIITDLNRFKPQFSSGPVYVDPIDGLDTNDGKSWSSSFKTMAKAIDAGVTQILVRGNTILPYESRLSSLVVNRDMYIEAVGGPVFAGCVLDGTWSTSGPLNVFTPSESGNTPVAVFDTGDFSHETYGYKRLTQVSSLALCQSTENSWFRDSSDGYKVYVHVRGGATSFVSRSRIVLNYARPNYGVQFSNGSTFYIKGFRFFGTHNIGSSGGVFTVKAQSSYVGGVFFNEDCEFSCSFDQYANGLSVFDVGLCISVNSKCNSNRRDGFNYHVGDSGVVPNFIEYNCSGFGNGFNDGNTNNNGSTAHEGCAGVRVNCSYGASRGPAIKDIDESRVYNVAISCTNSIAGFVVTDSDTRDGSPVSYIDGIYLSGNNVRSSSTESGDITANGPSANIYIYDASYTQPAYTTNASSVSFI